MSESKKTSVVSESSPYDAVIKALQMLKRVKRLEGTFFLKDGELLSADTLLGISQNEGFAREVNALLAQYKNAGRPLTRALIGFEEGNVLIFQAAPYTICLLFGDLADAAKIEHSGEEFFRKWGGSLGLDGAADHTLPAVPKSAAFPSSITEEKIEEESADEDGEATGEESETADDAEQEATPSPVNGAPKPSPQWNRFRTEVEALLAKVLGRSRAHRMVTRELGALGLFDEQSISPEHYCSLGGRLLEKVKDESLRKRLEDELDEILEKEDY